MFQNRTGSIEFLVLNGFKRWNAAYSDIMDYLHGQTMKAVLEDEPDYFYEGRFVVSSWKSDKDWSKITIDYDVGPYKWSIISSIDDWLWDPFNFQNGVILTGTSRNIEVTTSERRCDFNGRFIGRAPMCPSFHVETTEKRGMHVRFANERLGIDSEKVLNDGITQFPEFIFFGESVSLYFRCDSGTGTVSIEFRQGRL